jgi:hypothetical protein
MATRLITEFLTDAPNFALGFEAGIIYNQMRSGVQEIEGQYNISNQDQLFMMAGNLGYEVKKWEKLDQTWMFCKFNKKLL